MSGNRKKTLIASNFFQLGLIPRDRSENMALQNTFRAYKTQAIVNVLAKIEAGDVQTFSILPTEYELWDYEEAHKLPDSDSVTVQSLSSTLIELQGELNSYRAGKIAREVLAVNLDKTKLLAFAKPKTYAYGLSAKMVLSLAFENRLAIKKLLIVEHHNLKLSDFPYLKGLYWRKMYQHGTDFTGLMADSDVFADGFCHQY